MLFVADLLRYSIVAVHGLDLANSKGHAYNTWTDKGKLWLKDFLPSQAGMPRSRVLLFGYNSSAAFRTSTVGVAGAAINLLDQLRFKRREHPERPIVFVCHSLGGIVAKQALVEAHNADEVHGQILRCTKGVAFFGTPHTGGHGARLGDSIVRIVQSLTGDVRNDIFEWLRTDSFLSSHLAINFARRARNLRVVSFQENLPISDRPFTRHFGLVVPPASSALNWKEPAETAVLMEASHTTICKFASPQDELYIRVADHMLDLLTWAIQPSGVPIPRLSIDIPPPPYSLEASVLPTPMRRKQSYIEHPESTANEFIDGDELAPGWLERIRAASPLRSPSPRPQNRQRNSSMEENTELNQAQSPVWPIVMLPYQRNPYYVHRSEIFNQMIALMNVGSPIFLQGIGGCGKTQMAIHLSHWFRDRDPEASIMWINGTSPNTALAGLGLVASRLGIKNTEGEEHRLLALKERLKHPRVGHWLMIFDAADDSRAYEAVSSFIPRCTNGQVLLTSRRTLIAKDLAMLEYVFDLSKVTAFEGAAIVHTTMADDILTKIDPPDMDHFLRKLEYLPLAITQAVAYMNKNHMSLKMYLAKISDEALLAEQLSQNSISDDYISGLVPAVYSTFKLSFERLAAEQPGALHILGHLSFLQTKAIPTDLVNVVASLEPLSNQAMDDLGSYSFIQWTEDQNFLNLKRLVQVAIQRWLQETDQLERHKILMVNVISGHFPNAAQSMNWSQCEVWLPHALRILETCEKDADKASIETPNSAPSEASTTTMTGYIRDIAQLKGEVGLYYHKLGHWTSARDYLEEALEASRQNFGTMDDLTLNIQANLVQTLRYLGQLKRASENARDLKRSRKAKSGKKDQATLDSYRIYALSLQDLGQWKDSVRASEKALSGYRDLHKADPRHPDVIRMCRRTSWGYIALGQYNRAEALLQEAITGCRKGKDVGSDYGADCYFTLAMLQNQMKRFEEAKISARECLTIRKSLMKKSHPDVLKTQWLIGISLQGQHKWEEAKSLFMKILEQAQNRPGVGREHMYTLKLLYSLGTLQEDRAAVDEAMLGDGAGRDGFYRAISILDEVLIGRIATLGPDHLETLATRARLAGLHLTLGDSVQGRNESQQVLKIVTRKEYRRAGMVSTAVEWMCLSNLAGCASAKAKELERLPGQDKDMKDERKMAVNYAKQVAEGMEKTLGKQNPDTLNAAKMWAMAVLATGDSKTAGKVAQRFAIAVPGKDDSLNLGYRGILGQ